MKKKEYTINDMIMKRPASAFANRWRDATPIGNGITGALLYGGVSAEHIVINRGDLWYGGINAPVPDVTHCLEQMRALQKEGKYQEATNIMHDELIDTKKYGSVQADMRALGCVKLILKSPGVYHSYRRVIHMDTSEVEISYFVDEAFYKRRYLASRARDIIAIDIVADEALDCVLNSGFFKSFEGKIEEKIQESDKKYAKYRAKGDCYVYSSKQDDKYFGIVCRVISDGETEVDEKGIEIKNSKHSLILIKSFSEEENRFEAEEKNISDLNHCPADYQSIYEENLPLFSSLYQTADISLFEGEVFHSNEELLEASRDSKMSAELAEKIWRFGRYLFISGTSLHGLPFPLYGLWPSGYERMFTQHVANENVQSIYWHTDVGGLSELTAALINYYYEKMEFFRENARNLYGCRGIFVGAYSTPKNSTITSEVPVILHFLGVAGWLSQHFYKYYLYTNDTELFEGKILPFMIEAAEFYEDFYYLDENGKMVLYPAVSPENTPLEYEDKTKFYAPMPVTKNPTVELAILKELLLNLIASTQGRTDLEEKIKIWKYMLSIIPEYQINEDGMVREWMTPELSDNIDHRHISHIYPLFPGTELEDYNRKDLMPAFKLATDRRGYGSFCGWSMPHMSAIYARLCDSKKAYRMLDALAKVCLLDNFFTLGHDYRDMGITGYDTGDEVNACVQFDAILGAVNAIQEMLLFSSEKILRILPACPEEFGKGKAKLHFCGGVVDICWDLEKKICNGTITACRDVLLKLELPFDRETLDLALKANETFAF